MAAGRIKGSLIKFLLNIFNVGMVAVLILLMRANHAWNEKKWTPAKLPKK